MNQPLDHLDKLKVFVAVAEKGKINEASKILGLTQPSVSRSIQTLEAAFGVQLFVRGRYGVRLTTEGNLLYRSASGILREVGDLSFRIKNAHDELAGSLVIASYASLAEYLWPDFLVKLRKTHPNLRLSIKTGESGDSLSQLISGQIDLLVDAEPQTSEETTSWGLYSDFFNFYVSKSKRAIRLSPSDVSSEALLYVPHAYDRENKAIEDHLRISGFRFAREYTFDSFATVKRLAERGLGIAVLPNRLAQQDLRNRKISKVSLMGFSDAGFGRHTIYATCATQRATDPRIRKLVSMLKVHFQKML